MYKIIALFLIFAVLSSCGGGGGSSDGSGLSNNACSDLGLATKSLRIIDGTACASLDRSAVVRVLLLDSTGAIAGFCSGTLLSPLQVLTAAHCFDRSPHAVAVSSGDPGDAIAISARSVRIHPRYQSNSQAAFNDVALINLNLALTAPTLPLLRSSAVQVGDIISIFGYGTDENGTFDGLQLRSGQMQISSISSDHIDAEFDGEGSNTCTGDSGGPLTVRINGVTSIVGVTSTGRRKDCGPGDFSRAVNLQSPAVISFLDRYAQSAQKK